jgi:hypothetical protein
MRHSLNRHYRRRRRPGEPPIHPGPNNITSQNNNNARRNKAKTSADNTFGSTAKAIICFIILNSAVIIIFVWLWYSGVLILPHASKRMIASHNNNHVKVEKRWRKRNALASPILVVGLPKAGTSSLFEFFQCHGVYSQHWYCCGPQHWADQPGSGGPIHGPSYMSHCLLENLHSADNIKSSNILDGCGDYDAYTELNGPHLPSYTTKQQQPITPDGIFLPQHYHLQELHDAAPTATWILNLRPVDDWIRSVMNVPAHRLLEQFQQEAAKHHSDGDTNTTTPVITKQQQHMRGRRERDAQFLQDFWKTHVDRVKKFANEYPQHTLITVNISHPNAGVDLAKDLGWFTTTSTTTTAPPYDPTKNSSITSSPSKARACWKRYNVGEYIE